MSPAVASKPTAATATANTGTVLSLCRRLRAPFSSSSLPTVLLPRGACGAAVLRSTCAAGADFAANGALINSRARCGSDCSSSSLPASVQRYSYTPKRPGNDFSGSPVTDVIRRLISFVSKTCAGFEIFSSDTSSCDGRRGTTALLSVLAGAPSGSDAWAATTSSPTDTEMGVAFERPRNPVTACCSWRESTRASAALPRPETWMTPSLGCIRPSRLATISSISSNKPGGGGTRSAPGLR